MKKKVALPVIIILVLALFGYTAYTVHQIRNPDTLFKKSRIIWDKDSGNKSQKQQKNSQRFADIKENADK